MSGKKFFPYCDHCKAISCPGKENHYKMKPFQSDVAFSYLQSSGNKCNNNCFLQSVMAILTLVITLILQLILQDLKQYLDLKQYFLVQIQLPLQLPLCHYEMYLPVLKALLNDLKDSYKNET